MMFADPQAFAGLCVMAALFVAFLLAVVDP
jgi:hypothetical protein